MKWLITAFAPFGGAKSNSSQLVLDQLRRGEWGGRLLFHAPVPVEFNRAWNDICQVLDQAPDIEGVLALGQAETRSRISLERVALNWNDARLPDNAGWLPPQAAIHNQAPDVYWSNIPWQNFELSDLSERSYSAGTYVCNNVMFQALDWAKSRQKKAGFVHIPVLSSQEEPVFAKSPKLSDQAAVEEVSRILEFLLKL